jgi:cytochrome P450
MVIDHAGMDAIFNADPSELDRQTEPGFGCLALHCDELLDGVVPALVSHSANHGPARSLIDKAMAHRIEAFAPACNRVLEEGWPALKGVDTATFEHATVQTAAGIMFRWLFDLEGPAGHDHLQWIEGCFGLTTDTWITNVLAHLVVRPPKQPVRDYSKAWLEKIRRSAPYSAFVQMGAEVGVSEEQVAPHMLFCAGFNGTAGAYSTAFPGMAQIYSVPAIREKLANELSGFDGDVNALEKLPYLDAILHEVMRLYGRPKQYYRRVVQPTTVPMSDGRQISVKPGDQIGLMALCARRDPAVFSNPIPFDPERYLDDRSLKEKVYIFGPPHQGKSPYGCAGASNGTASRLWKTVVASLCRDTDWRLSPDPVPNIDAKMGVDPTSLTWHRS